MTMASLWRLEVIALACYIIELDRDFRILNVEGTETDPHGE